MVVNITLWPFYTTDRTPLSMRQEFGLAPEPIWVVLEKRKIPYSCQKSHLGRNMWELSSICIYSLKLCTLCFTLLGTIEI